jgi:diguanylate cyclase (GGDEF)-like protein
MGGDEFIALLPRTSGEVAREMARALDQALRSVIIPFEGKEVRISASFGCAEADPAAISWGVLIGACDKALYEAKSDRRRVGAASVAVPEPAV